MYCLVADNEREVEADPIGRRVSRRLKAVAKSRGFTVGQVYYHMKEAVTPEELPSLKTVETFLRGSQVNPSFDVVFAVARGLGLTIDQILGLSPMPEATPMPIEDDLSARVDRLESTLRTFLNAQADIEDEAAREIEQGLGRGRRVAGGDSLSARRQRKGK